MTDHHQDKTQQLIAALANDSIAVEPLGSPHLRMLMWFSVGIVYAAIVVASVGIRSDIFSRLSDTQFMVEISAALMTSMFAAAAALCAGCPGRPVWERFAPLPPLILWFGVLVFGCWQSWLNNGADAFKLTNDLVCLPCIVLIALVPGGLIFAMIQKGAPVAPKSTMALATLAAVALSAAALRLFYIQDSHLMVLTWQFGSVIALTLAGAAAGTYLLRWPTQS